MIKRYAFVLFLVIFSAVLFYQPAAAKEDTAQITLKKTAISKNKLYTYTVKKGDVLSTIIRNIPGITEEDISSNYQLIKELNPDVPDLDNLEVGQSLVLPGKPLTETKKTKVKKTTVPTANISSNKRKNYTIKRGDTIYNIIRRKLKVTETNIPQMLKLIKSINPRIANFNKIYPGTVIKLPSRTVFAKTPDETKAFTQKVVKLSEKISQPDKIIEIKEKIFMPPEARLAVLKQVITQMHGSINTMGNYYLPIPKTGQVTIDCSKIPVIEFDDGTTVFLDLENRAHSNLKKMISDNWKNYYLVNADRNDDVIAILKKVINTTVNYSMIKSGNPVTIGALPPVELIFDWIIIKSSPKQQSPSLVQGLRLIYENNPLLPKSVKNYSQKNNLIITEISNEKGIVEKPEEVYSLPPIPFFPTTSVKDFSYVLVSNLGLNAEKDVDIQIFDTIKDGFNLSIKADVLVKKDDKKYIIYSQNLSPQFTNALKQAGNELILVSENDAPKIIMEKILNGLNIPVNSGNFTFSGLDKNQAPFALKFSGTKIKTDKNLYVVDFDIDLGLRGLLQEVWSANITRY
ncbi:MAG: LysM peptidoglycan-binding domain-containing protein [Deltaproteobacteria bacterium]|nr:LysM peptidoglycan-binding domain-containing protein [Deltaproteobacteria bacterium]